MALLSLCQGASDLEASRQSGLTREGVRKIRIVAEVDGVDAMVSEVHLAVERRDVAPSQARVKGAERVLFERFWPQLRAEAEPVVEVVALVVHPMAKVAIFAFRGAREARRGDSEGSFSARGSELAHAVSQAIQSDEEVEDIESIPNKWMSRAKLEIPVQPAGDSGFDFDGLSLDLKSLPPSGLDLGAKWGFMAVQSGDPGRCEKIVRKLLGRRNCVKMNYPDAEFLPRLSGACSRLRLSWNIIGLFPIGFVVNFALRAWHSCPDRFKFTYWITEEGINEGIRASLLSFYHLGYGFGFVNQLTATMRAAIPGAALFPIRIAPLRPLVRVEREGFFEGNLDEWGVTVRGFPGGQGNFLPSEKPQSEAKVIRTMLRKKGALAGLRYAVRLEDAARAWTDQDAALDDDRQVPGTGSAVILFPRHFLMRGSSVKISRLARIARNCSRQKLEGAGVAKADPDFLIFHSTAICAGIRLAFEKNRISATAVRFKLACEDLLKRHSDRLLRQFPPKEWPSWTHLRHEFICPYHYFSRERLSGNLTSPLRSDLAWQGYDVTTLPEVGRPFSVEYSADESLRNVYRDLDADFLLRHLDLEIWSRIHPLAEQWRKRIEEVIFDKFWPKSRLAVNLVAALAPPQHSDAIRGDDLEATKILGEALNRFLEGSARVFRQAVENAQRLVLAGHAPSAIVVRSKREILRTWGAFLKKRLRRLFEVKVEQTRSLEEMSTAERAHWLDEEDGEEDGDDHAWE